ncbi:hypothetical protein IV102_09960 [bacterium]|nr:hypothetical protein [bacterium]
MKRHNKRIGIFLIGVMLVVVLVAMFVGASFELGVWGLKRNLNQSDVSAAQRAARSGLAYVLSRLRNDGTWKANTPMTTAINEPDLIVVEEYGNVIGLLRNGAQTSQFRVRFNYYDGTGGGDGMDDPSAAMRIDWPRVCFNNCAGNAAVTVPLVNGPGSSVPAVPTAYADLPSRGIFVAVEGRCGSWLSQATLANPNPTIPPTMRASVSHVETVYKVVTPPQGSPAVAGSAGDFVAQVATTNKKDNLSLDSSDATKIPRIRSRGNLFMSGGKLGEDNVVAGSKGGQYGGLVSVSGVVTGSATLAVEGPSDPLLGVGWSSIDTAVANVDPTVNVLPAGVYSVWQDGNFHYYDTDLAGYRALMTANPNAPGTVNPTLPGSVQYSWGGGKAKFQIKESTFVQATGTTSDLTIIPKIGVDAGPNISDPNFTHIPTVTDTLRSDKVTVDFKPGASKSAVVTTAGKFNLGGKLAGDGGSITAEDSINVVGLGVDLSALSNPKQGVSLYTKKNLLMSTYDDAGATYKKVALKGVVYAWGDVKMNLGDTTGVVVDESKWGKFDLTGAMVAYGKDPSDLIAVPNPAKIDITAKEINLKYDETYVQSILSGLPGTFELKRTRWLQN